MKFKKSRIIALSATAASALAVGVALPLTLISQNTTNVVSTNDITDGESERFGVQYTTVKFQAFNADPDVKFEGQTDVRAKVGRQFCTIAKPKATKSGQRFVCWSIDGTEGGKILDTALIPAAGLVIYPVFEENIVLSNCVSITAIEPTEIEVEIKGVWTDLTKPDIQYTKNYGDEWIDAKDTPIVKIEPGQNIFFRGNNASGFSVSEADYVHFIFRQPTASTVAPAVNIGGNIMGLLDNANEEQDITNIPNDYCFYHLFENSNAIKYVSDTFLPSLELKDRCYEGLFYNCSSILSAPALPADVLNPVSNEPIDGCYKDLFRGCSSLNRVNLIEYEGIFYSSTFDNWLTDVSATGSIIYNGTDPERSGSTIPVGWTINKPTTSIEIECEEIEDWNYEFVLNHPYQLKATISTGSSTDVTWASSDSRVVQVNPHTGVLTVVSVPENLDEDLKIYCKATDGSGKEDEQIIKVRGIDVDNDCTVLTTAAGKIDVKWDYVGEGTVPEFKYSVDGKAWLKLWPGAKKEIDTTGKIYIKGNNPGGVSAPNANAYAHFTFSKNVTIGGSIMSLVDDGRGEATTIPCNYCFNNVFNNNNTITSISSGFLPSVDLTDGCYANLFSGCSKLETAPSLPATKLKKNCYYHMFSGCSSLSSTPSLLAGVTTGNLAEACYAYMFSGCTSLTESPELGAATAAKQCYMCMFQGATGITKFNEVKITTIPEAADQCCFQMFCDIKNKLAQEQTPGSRWKKIITAPSNVEDPELGTDQEHMYVFRMFYFKPTIGSVTEGTPGPSETWCYYS